MKRFAIFIMMFAFFGGITIAQAGPPAPNSFYVDDILYRTVGTPAELPDEGPKDGLYVFQNLSGQTPVAEAKPGDQDYNGGRWVVSVLAFTEEGEGMHDLDGDGVVNFELTYWEQVNHHISLGHLEKVADGPSFVCPVIKQKNQN